MPSRATIPAVDIDDVAGRSARAVPLALALIALCSCHRPRGRGRRARTSSSARRCCGRWRCSRRRSPSCSATFPYDFLYGSIAADTSIAKKYAPAGRHCHSWTVGLEIYDKARDEPLRASRSAISRISRRTPSRTTTSCRSSSRSRRARRRWATATGRAASRRISGRRYSRRARELILLDHSRVRRPPRSHPEPDDLQHADQPPALSRHGVRDGHGVVAAHLPAGDGEQPLGSAPIADVARYMERSYDFIIDFLSRVDYSEPYALDPPGDEALRLAKRSARAIRAKAGMESRMAEEATRQFGMPESQLALRRGARARRSTRRRCARRQAADSRVFGSARPFDFFITSPTSTPCSFFSPPRKRVASSGFSASTSSTQPASCVLVAYLQQPLALGDLARRARRSRPSIAKIFFAAAWLTVPSRTSVEQLREDRRRELRSVPMLARRTLSSCRTSPITQFAARLRIAVRARDLLEVVGEPRIGGEHLDLVRRRACTPWRSARCFAAGARAARCVTRVDPLAREHAAAEGRARGNSDSRGFPPCVRAGRTSPRVRIPEHRLLRDLARRASSSAHWRANSHLERALDAGERVHVLHFGLRAELRLAAQARADVRVDAEASLLHVHVAHADVLEHLLERAQIRAGLARPSACPARSRSR